MTVRSAPRTASSGTGGTVLPVVVSVVVPVRDGGELLAAAVSSALSQTHPLLEVIVVDDGSADGAPARLARSDPRLRVLSLGRAGVSAARNRGIAAATGDVVAFLDADDLWDPDKLAVQLGVLARNPEVVAVGSLMRYLHRAGHRGVTGTVLTTRRAEAVRQGRLMPFPLSSLLARRDALVATGGFDEDLDQAEDLDLVARLAALGGVATVTRPLGSYRLHDKSASSRDFLRQRQAARFVCERVAARSAGVDLRWAEFTARPRSFSQRWLDTAAMHYRQAGVSWGTGRRTRAALLLASALTRAPRYVLKRLRRQLLTRAAAR